MVHRCLVHTYSPAIHPLLLRAPGSLLSPPAVAYLLLGLRRTLPAFSRCAPACLPAFNGSQVRYWRAIQAAQRLPTPSTSVCPCRGIPGRGCCCSGCLLRRLSCCCCSFGCLSCCLPLSYLLLQFQLQQQQSQHTHTHTGQQGALASTLLSTG